MTTFLPGTATVLIFRHKVKIFLLIFSTKVLIIHWTLESMKHVWCSDRLTDRDDSLADFFALY